MQRCTVDRPATDAERLFEDRTIEAVETREEAVVAKEARVKEELVIRKSAEDRVETIHDTVRHTEVTVDDDRKRLPAPSHRRQLFLGRRAATACKI